jgi:hypothetical protein
MQLRGGAVLGLATLWAIASCRPTAGTTLMVTVTLSGSSSGVAGLDVRLIGLVGTSEKLYGVAGQSIVFPTTFSAELPLSVTGDVVLDVKAININGETVAEGRAGPFTLRVGMLQNVLVHLDCGGETCNVDGGQPEAVSSADGASGAKDQNCGNGRIDVGETCDIAIAPDTPGACPPADCDAGIPCLVGTHIGQACNAYCVYREITSRVAGDRCCPAGATNADDSDCPTTCGNGFVDVGETCDIGISVDAPGACPNAAECNDGGPCTISALISAGTCDAICAFVPITVQSGTTLDGCCPAGAWHAVDADCPTLCGDGQLTSDKLCDPGLSPNAPDLCPNDCDDGNPCTVDVRDGAGCQVHCVHSPITALIAGDGCCPMGANHRTDSDCPPACGNGVVEVGESCEPKATGTGACPTSCPPSPSACLMSVLVGDASMCTARCELTRVTTCGASDGCCADGCTAATDPDCSPTCGDGLVQSANGETCDIGIAAGMLGACPTSCSSSASCTQGVLVSAGTCQAICLSLPITAPRAGDGCCPAGADATLDPDCAPVCGNGAVEPPSETCDYAAAVGACPATCPGGDACTRIQLEGTAGSCNATCTTHSTTACVSGDGCCPISCTIENDSDCPAICGDGVRSSGEACDRSITAGFPGACLRTCDDGDACTGDWASGTVEACSRECTHTPITACRTGDGCCPAGCNAAADHDCAPICGDGMIGSGETCDPPASCPTTCPDDGDPCTREVLVGDDNHCDVVCRHIPIISCSGQVPDFCCPTSCNSSNDVDCTALGHD